MSVMRFTMLLRLEKALSCRTRTYLVPRNADRPPISQAVVDTAFVFHLKAILDTRGLS